MTTKLRWDWGGDARGRVVCVLMENWDRTWCGKPREGFQFTDIDRAAFNGFKIRRVGPFTCEDCVTAICRVLKMGQAEERGGL